MSNTKKYRDQHDQLLEIASEILPLLDTEKLSENASDVRTLLSKLLGILNVHLAMEDKSLYPQLLNHPDSNIQSMARGFISEMGDIGLAVDDYKAHWSSTKAIQSDPAGFITMTKNIFNALTKRIDRENNELYKAVDAL